MITPVPQRVNNSKDAILWSILNTLEQIDDNPQSRAQFGYQIAGDPSIPAFNTEIALIREELGVKHTEEQQQQEPQVYTQRDPDEINIREL